MRNGMKMVSPNTSQTTTTTEGFRRPADIDTLIDVARSYYIDDQQKGDIARRLNIDSRKIVPYLLEAKRTGLVKIDIHEPPSTETLRLEDQLMTRYRHLKFVRVISVRRTDKEARFAAFTRRATFEAAQLFEDFVRKGEVLHIGMSGGETWLEFVNAVPERPRKAVYVYATTLIGRGQLTMSASHVDAVVNATVLWSKCGREPGHNRYATVPPYDSVGTRLGIKKELEAMARRKPIETVIREMDKITLAFVGVGVIAPPHKSPRKNARLTMLSLLQPFGPSSQTLVDEGAVGEMGGSLFDEDGTIKSDWRFFLSAGHYHPKGGGIEFYKRMVDERKSVVVIAGVEKEAAVGAALRAKAFNYWFTDEATARKVLEEE